MPQLAQLREAVAADAAVARSTRRPAGARRPAAPAAAGAGTRSRPTTRSWARPARAAEIYVYGMRNPCRWSFDRQTGDMLDRRRRRQRGARGDRPSARARQTRGANLGWNCREGNAGRRAGCTPASYVAPVHDYPQRRRTWSSAATWCATPRCPRSRAATCSAASTRGVYQLDAGRHARRRTARRSPALSASARTASATLRDLAQRAGLPARARTAGARDQRASATSTSRWPSRRSRATPAACSSSSSDRRRQAPRRRRRRSTTSSTSRPASRPRGEQGLLAFAAAPDYAPAAASSPTTPTSGSDLQLDEYRAPPTSPDRADPARAGRLLTIQHDQAEQPQRRPAAVRPGRLPLPLDRRRRHAGRPGGRRPEPRLAAREDPAPRRRRRRRRGRSTPRAPRCARRSSAASACCACAARSPTCAAASAARSRPAGGCGSAKRAYRLRAGRKIAPARTGARALKVTARRARRAG